MRVATLEVQGFRAFGASKSFDFDADAVIVVAPNGTGKTSLFDAILWGLTGAVPRLRSDTHELISLYSGTGEARVSLTLVSKDGAPLKITRRALGDDQQLRIEHNGEILKEKASAQSKLLSALWPAASRIW
jgi:DNA repair exonuclease SbcCD ATPase subunit